MSAISQPLEPKGWVTVGTPVKFPCLEGCVVVSDAPSRLPVLITRMGDLVLCVGTCMQVQSSHLISAFQAFLD